MLRFLYDERGMLPGPLPKTEEQMLTTGDETAVLPPAGAGLDCTGYMLFSSKGRWQVTVTQSGAQLGVLLVEVA